MSFTKIQKAISKEVAKGKKPFKDGEQLELKFTPSTKKEIKEYARKAAEAEEAKKHARLTKPERAKLSLEKNLPFDFKRPNALRRVFKECIEERRALYLKDKKKDPRWAPRFPRYEMFEKQSIADSNFVFDMQSCIAGFSWKQLTELLHAAAGGEIKTKDYSEAFHLFQNVMHQALGVELDSSGTRYRLEDRDEVLSKWNVEIVKRKQKMPKKEEEEKVKKVRGAAKTKKVKEEDDEEEDDEVEEAAEDEDDEDEAEEADESEDEDEDESEDEDEDEDEEEEKPKKKKAKVKPAPVKKKKKAADEDDDEDDEAEKDEDEDADEESDDDEDEDEDGDDTPKSKGKKVAKKVKKVEKEKPGKKKPAKERSSRNPDAVYKVKKKFTSGGVREQCQSVIPAKGATVEAIGAAMKKKFDIDPKKARSYVSWLTANGFLTRIDD